MRPCPFHVAQILVSDSTAVHSYPPTPPTAPIAVTSSPPPVDAKLDTMESAPTGISKKVLKMTPTKITQFLLAPHSSPHVPCPQPGEQRTLFTRALSLFQNHKPSHTASFTLCALDGIGSAPQVAGPSSQPRQLLSQLIPKMPSPLLTFHDRTPVLTVGSVTGLLEIDRAEERILGVDTSFWIAVALTYLEFLEERESYLAALTD
ncbi:hypothetical protein J3R82DRAFT_8751 [Butyriboletus roseoflavus]|nr:hypothetical protein J3R82DRAFT_8751 [Butyriboletus roseoflavus]